MILVFLWCFSLIHQLSKVNVAAFRTADRTRWTARHHCCLLSLIQHLLHLNLLAVAVCKILLVFVEWDVVHIQIRIPDGVFAFAFSPEAIGRSLRMALSLRPSTKRSARHRLLLHLLQVRLGALNMRRWSSNLVWVLVVWRQMLGLGKWRWNWARAFWAYHLLLLLVVWLVQALMAVGFGFILRSVLWFIYTDCLIWLCHIIYKIINLVYWQNIVQLDHWYFAIAIVMLFLLILKNLRLQILNSIFPLRELFLILIDGYVMAILKLASSHIANNSDRLPLMVLGIVHDLLNAIFLSASDPLSHLVFNERKDKLNPE